MYYFKHFLIWVLIFTYSNLVHAQWENIGLPKGFSFDYSYIDQSGAIFLDCFFNGIYYSEDHGKNWVKSNILKYTPVITNRNRFVELNDHSILTSLYSDVYSFNRTSKEWELYIKEIYQLISIDHLGRCWYKANNKNMLMTKDKGKTYQEYKLTNVSIVDSYKNLFNICIKGSSVYKFTDTLNFTKIQSFVDFNHPFLFINQSTGTIFTNCETQKLCRSTDGGNIWSTVTVQNNPTTFLNMQLMGDGSLLLETILGKMISKDDGITWGNLEDIITGEFPYSEEPNNIGFINSSDTILALNSNCNTQGLYTSVDNGASWKGTNDSVVSPIINKIIEDSLGNLYALGCSDTTALMTKNNGDNWTKFLIKYNNKNYGVKDLAINDNGEIFAVSSIGVFRSTSLGSNFIKLEAPKNAFDQGRNYNIFLSANGFIYILSLTDSLSYISIDEGVSWKSIKFHFGSNIRNIQTDEIGNFYFVDENFKTLGKYVFELDSIEFYGQIYGLFRVTKNGLIYFFKNNALNVSKDKMKSFEVVNNDPFITYFTYVSDEFFSDNNSNLYKCSKYAIYISEDGGKHFHFWNIRPDSSSTYKFYISPFQSLLYHSELPVRIYSWTKKLSSGTPVNGIVYNDFNKNCNIDSLEDTIDLVPVALTGTNNLNTYSGINGQYNCRLEEGIYSFSALVSNAFWESCSISNIVISPNQKDTVHVNIGLQVKEYCPYLSIQIQTPSARRCFDNNIYLKYCNEGTAVANNANLLVTLPDKISFISSTVTPALQNGQEISFDLGDIQPGDCGDIIIKTHLSCDAKINDFICLTAKMGPENQCAIVLPNFSEVEKCNIVSSSFDPNLKMAYINGKPSKGYTEKNQDIEYLIKFQNTGTDTAFRVVIIDQLPEAFDISSIKILNFSHPLKIEIEDQRTIRFIFDPIMLPDSNINVLGSHGFVAFKVSPKSDLPYGTTLDNFADIYFDYNKAIRTDTAYLTVSQITNSVNLTSELKINCYPNPTKGELNLFIEEDSSNDYVIMMKDIFGKVLFIDKFNGSSYLLKRKSGISPGIYFLFIKDSYGKYGFVKFILK